MNDYLSEFGEPDINLAGLKLWVHGYQFPYSEDRWDGNWLNATAICSEGGASVLVRGNFIRTDEIAEWLSAVEKLEVDLASEAKLSCMEPNLAVTLKGSPLGAIEMDVRITPDQVTQDHKFIFTIDQSYLKSLSTQCSLLLGVYPLRRI